MTSQPDPTPAEQAALIDGMAAWLDIGLNRNLLTALKAGAAALRREGAVSNEIDRLKTENEEMRETLFSQLSQDLAPAFREGVVSLTVEQARVEVYQAIWAWDMRSTPDGSAGERDHLEDTLNAFAAAAVRASAPAPQERATEDARSDHPSPIEALTHATTADAREEIVIEIDEDGRVSQPVIGPIREAGE